MELINRYIHEVGRRLPKKKRGDIEAELQSLILDSLEGRLPEDLVESGDVPEEIQVEVLKEFGPPRKVAQQYYPTINYVIGPRLMEPYVLTLTIVLGIVLFANLFGILSLGAEFNLFNGSIGDALAGLITSLQAAFGSVTFVFALIERALAHSTIQDEDSQWDPRKMPSIADNDRVKASGLIIEILFLAFLLIMLNVYPDRIGVSFVRIGGEFKTTSWLKPEIVTTYGPWLSAMWFLSIILNITVLAQRRWQPITHVLNAALTLYGAYLFYRIATGPSFIATVPGGIIGSISGVPDILNDITDSALRWVVGVTAALHAFSAAKILYHFFDIKPIVIPPDKTAE
ncbi:MAG: hypothetical protein P1S60_14060 [Anaerolineae bacterium]|nr:hypothetical protein [Anaerolineae bacterium]